MDKIKTKDIMPVGLTMFAIFFGAGNLIFPPYLGRETGAEWFIGFFFFFLVDVGVSMLSIFSTIRSGDYSMTGIPSRLGKKGATIVAILIATCLAPCLCVPRTAATTFEMGWAQMFPNLSIWIFSFVYFAVVCFLTIRPSKVVDIVGNYLTPLLVACIIVLLILGTVIDALPLQMILVPILLPAVIAYGINPIHFGVVVIFNLMIGILTPPMGTALFVVARVGNIPFKTLVKGVIPFLIPLLITLILLNIFPEITLFLPRLLTGGV